MSSSAPAIWWRCRSQVQGVLGLLAWVGSTIVAFRHPLKLVIASMTNAVAMMKPMSAPSYISQRFPIG
jgi:hypothetical protein